MKFTCHCENPECDNFGLERIKYNSKIELIACESCKGTMFPLLTTTATENAMWEFWDASSRNYLGEMEFTVNFFDESEGFEICEL